MAGAAALWAAKQGKRPLLASPTVHTVQHAGEGCIRKTHGLRPGNCFASNRYQRHHRALKQEISEKSTVSQIVGNHTQAEEFIESATMTSFEESPVREHDDSSQGRVLIPTSSTRLRPQTPAGCLHVKVYSLWSTRC